MKKYPKYKENAMSTEIIETNSENYYGKGYQDVDRRVPSINNAKQKLNWAPKVDMLEALQRTLDFHFLEEEQKN